MKLTNLFSKKETIDIHSFANADVIRLENIPDKAFSYRMIGDGLAVEIDSLEIYAPCNGIIETIAATKHAFALTLSNGAQLLIHIGLYQDKPYPDYFHYHVNTGDKVSKDTHILTLSQKLLDMNNGKIMIPIVVLNYKEHPIKSFTTSSYVKKDKVLYTIK